MPDLEQLVRGIVRSELGYAGSAYPSRFAGRASSENVVSTKAMASAVRAEIARVGRRRYELADVLGLSRPTVAGRLSGAYEFKRAELEKVAAFIGITLRDLIESAEMGERFANPTPGPGPEPESARELWAQPARSLNRRSGTSR